MKKSKNHCIYEHFGFDKKSKSNNTGITLIALIITIIVLLILAGVTIAALTGSDSAPSKANEASQKQDIGAAKDDVSLAVTNAITDAYQTAYVETGVSAGEASTTVGTEVIKTIAQKYQTNNQIGKATIEIDGFGSISTVTGNATVTISTTDFVVEGTIYKDGGKLTWGEIEPNQPSIKITNAPKTLGIGKNTTLTTQIKRVTPTPTITWTSSSNSLATVTAEGKVNGIAAGDVIITAKITVDGVDYLDNCSITIKEEKFLGDARQADKYGYKVTGYDAKLTEVECWRLFYQDDDNTYLIANIPQGSISEGRYNPSTYYAASGETRYTTGGSVSEVGKNLNEKYYKSYQSKFTLGETPMSMRTVAWMTDTNNALWSQYVTGNASWAIASPTIELFVESYNAVKRDIDKKIEAGTTTESARTEKTAIVHSSGYTSEQNGLNVNYNHGIYNYRKQFGNGYRWWLASPSYSGDGCLSVFGDEEKVTTGNVQSAIAVRPIVCIPTTTFNSAVASGTYTLTDE